MFFPIWACLLIVVIVPGLCIVGYRRGQEDGMEAGEKKLRKKYKSMYGDVLDNLSHYRQLESLYGGDESPHEQLRASFKKLTVSYQGMLQAVESMLYAHQCIAEAEEDDQALMKMHKESFEHWMSHGLEENLESGKSVIKSHSVVSH
ncbi:MAG: hypothetical protein KUG82_10510 [Pseudomonadales bacterium]|nr:hypothetical protein [Pseudomonadales bacterium]